MRNLFVTLLVMFQYTPNSWGDVVDPKSGKQITSFIKDAEVQEMLEGTKEFRDCRDSNKFDPAVTDTEKEKKIQAAEKCFKDKITKGKGLKELEELSKKLDLENYQLIRSKNVQDIQKYLDDKMYKSLTGVDRNEKDLKKMQEDLKFGRKKMIDHKVFMKLYRLQLGKNSIFEISRFCFEDLRKNGVSGDSFAEHWAGYTYGDLKNIKSINDQGYPKFGKHIDTTDKQKIYADIFKSIQGPNGKGLSDKQLSEFFYECGMMIVQLCEQFQNSMSVTGPIKKVDDSTPTNGGAACITKNRLQEYRKAMSKADEILKHLENEAKDDKEFKLIFSNLDNGPLKIYGDGQDSSEENIDDLTNYTSSDMLTQEDGNRTKKLDECQQRPELASCEGVISDDESFEKAKHDIESEMNLKRIVEMEKIKNIIKDDKKNLIKYLEDNNYYVIKKKYEEGELTEDEIEKEVGKAFEAKKTALLQQIHSKVGKRQISKNSNQQNTIDQTKADEVVQEAREEKGRLAQMILFNNIITSHLVLSDKNNKNIVGTNINVWNREKNALETNQVDPSLFQNIKQSNGKTNGIIDGENFDFIDQFLGK
jgi:hypothetical protein